jgi:autotransporter-associated beta strand protein
MNSPRHPLSALLLCGLLVLIPNVPAQAGSATWNLNPASGDWNTAANWTPATVPNGPDDIATFDMSNTPIPSILGNTVVNSIVFNSGASAFTITVTSGFIMPGFTLTISGEGIINNSGRTQNFITEVDNFLSGGDGGSISFTGAATAGAGSVFTVRGAEGNYGAEGGHIDFYESSTADSGSFINFGSVYSFGGVTSFHDSSMAGTGTFTNYPGAATFGGNGETEFLDNSSAGNAIITNEGATTLSLGGFVDFFGNSTAGNAAITNKGSSIAYSDGAWTTFWSSSSGGNATITSYGGAIGSRGLVDFAYGSTAGNATIICHGEPADGEGGTAFFAQSSTGGTARVELFGKGTLSLTNRDVREVTVGSIEGDGFVTLEDNQLIVGSNNLSTTFSGKIDGIGGSLTKIGRGTLALTGANTYTGGTTIDSGKLVVSNIGGSGTGTGPVQVNKGTLRGRGRIAGAVTLGTGSGPGAVLSPGEGRARPRTLTIQTLTFNSDAAYNFGLNSKTGIADKVVANGVTIVGGAQFSFAEFGGTALALGTVFTAIDNTAGTPITGTFSNLSDGSTLSGGSNTYQVSYEGGDGNDLTLTVVP